MITIEVTFADGNTIRTQINGTLEEAKKYYIGEKFNFGDIDGPDKMVEAVAVRQL